MNRPARAGAVQPLPNIGLAAQRRHIDALARRAQAHEGQTRRLLEARLQQLRLAMAERAENAKTPAPAAAGSPPSRAPGRHGLAQLLAVINGTGAPTAGAAPAAAHPVGQPATHPHTTAPELKAISQYRSTWSRLGAERRLHQALAQVPSNAGPLNTQRLLHQALTAMHSASPSYLHSFMVQIEALLWLEQQGLGVAPVADKRPAATRKPRG